MKTLILSVLFVLGCDNPPAQKDNTVHTIDTPIEYRVQPSVSMGGMSVAFPNPTQWKSTNIYIPNFGNTVYHHMMNVDNTGSGYMVAWVDYPIPQTTLSKFSDSKY